MAEFEKKCQLSSSGVPNRTIKALTTEFYTFKSFIWKSLDLLKSQVGLVASGMDRLETHNRRKILHSNGIKEEKDEDISKKIAQILTNHMKLSDLNPDTIET